MIENVDRVVIDIMSYATIRRERNEKSICNVFFMTDIVYLNIRKRNILVSRKVLINTGTQNNTIAILL